MPIRRNLMCRTCLQMNKSYVAVFEHREHNKLLADLLKECTGIEIDRFDGFPIYICNGCLEKLISAWAFKAMVIESDVKLRAKKSKVSALSPSDTCQDPPKIITCTETVTIKEEIGVKNVEVDLLTVAKENLGNNEIIEKNEVNGVKGINVNLPEYAEFGSSIFEENRESNDKENVEWSPIGNNDDSDSNEEFENDVTENSIEKEETENEAYDCSNDYVGIGLELSKNISKDDSIKEQVHGDFSDDVLPDTKDGRKLTRKEKEKMTVFCKPCNKSFGWKYYTSVHVRHHAGDKPYKCDVCEKAFVLPFQLKIHKRLHGDETPFSCDICGKPFKQLSSVYSHKLVHTQDRPHKCNICGKGFKQIYSLNVHIRIHTKDRMFMCEICGKSFTDHSTFSVHKTTHLTEKMYPCPVCNRSYASNVRMKEHHKKSHSDRKPHICSYCSKQFKESSTLKAHVLTHTGEKPFSCNICGKSFRQLACIPRHMRIHTGETPYPCKLCPARFKYSHHLKNHMKVHS